MKKLLLIMAVVWISLPATTNQTKKKLQQIQLQVTTPTVDTSKKAAPDTICKMR